jgi:hypothetical protein
MVLPGDRSSIKCIKCTALKRPNLKLKLVGENFQALSRGPDHRDRGKLCSDLYARDATNFCSLIKFDNEVFVPFCCDEIKLLLMIKKKRKRCLFILGTKQ